jgi:hypothetical protein
MEMIAWAELNDAFSEPVTASHNLAEYAPTQIVAEPFKTIGHDGVIYKSGLDSHGRPLCARSLPSG